MRSFIKWFHQHPELSLQEAETKARIIKELEALGDVEVVDVGAGVVGILRNGDGQTVAMRADFDGLPVKEDSGVEYASTATQVSDKTGQEVPVGHMCGHDMHTTWLLTTISYLAENREQWSGTFEAVFQPAEEIAEGGKDMVAAGITGKIPVPDVMLGQHVMGALPLGHVATNEGISFSQASTVKVTVRGVGSHGSMPEKGVDPIVLSSSIIMQLQTIVSRELPASERAVVSVGTIHGGTKSNVIPDKVVFELNTRCYSQEVEDHIHASIERIVNNQAAAAGAPEPSFEYSERFPVLDNDRDVTAKVTESMQTLLGEERTETFAPLSASEDFPDIPNAFGTPYCFWVVGGFPAPENAPGNHSPQFVPELHPTLEAGAEATVAALCPWLAV